MCRGFAESSIRKTNDRPHLSGDSSLPPRHHTFVRSLAMYFSTSSSPAFVLVFLHLVSASSALVGDDRPYRNLYTQDAANWTLARNLADIMAGGLEFMVNGGRFMTQEPPDTTPPRTEGVKYDFIVVGAGTAGATIASRLTENPDASVLLIEAGRSENLFMDIPVLVNFLQFSDDINWQYKTEPSDSYCLGMKNHQCAWPRGRVMGGSSVLNYMIATRGNRKDYDRWAELGNDGWSWNEVFPYFQKLETNGVKQLQNDTTNHNFNGPVYTGFSPFHTPIAKAFVEAGLEMGWKKVDYNGAVNTGFSYLQTTIKDGMRMSSNRAYLHPARNRPNLFVTKRSLATKILMDRENKRAIGVEFRKRNKRYQVYAKKEVILSAGAIGSPQLLMLSGVGPTDHLKNMGIKTLVDAPVGENLMDHISYGGLVFLTNQAVGISVPDMVNPALPFLGDFLLHRKGPLTIPGGCEALGFVNVDNPEDPDDFPNVELLFVSASVGTAPVFRDDVNLDIDFWRRSFANINGSYSWTVFPMLMRPKSRGKLLLRDSNIKSKPRLIPNYMSDPDDVRILIKGVRTTIALSKTKAMQRFGSYMHPTPIAGCENFEDDSDEYWECAVRSFTMNIYHYSGTCKMGAEGDPTAVVNPRLQVIGVQGLRVADASIMPEIITGHPNIPTFMIAEKLADMVKQDWGYRTDPLP